MKAASGGEFNLVVEAVGAVATWEAAPKLVRKGGAVNWFGGCPAGAVVTLDAPAIHYSSLTLISTFHHTPRAIRGALELIEAGVVRAADFVSGQCALEELPALRAHVRG